MPTKIVLALLLLGTTLWAQSYKAVYDLSSSDMRYMQNRVALIEKTAAMVKAQGDTPEFIITIHSGATPILAKLPDVYADEKDVPSIYAIHDAFKRLTGDYGVKILGCELAMQAYGMEADEVLPFIQRTPNSILNLIRLQQEGYSAIFFVR